LDHSDLNVDVDNSVSFIANESADDQVGHGTHVAGILAAKNNSSDVVGVAAGATVVAVKVCNKLPDSDPNSGCPVSSIVNGVDFVSIKAQPGDIINMSLGGNTSITDVDDAVINAANTGLRFTIAAGNLSINANNFTPARVEHPNVWTMSAYDVNDNFASFSNFGNPPIEYSGPGVDVFSLWKNNDTETISGTSMATPHIAGLLLTKPNDISTDGFVSNDPDGEPDPIAAYTPFTVSKSGPNFVDHGEQNTWTANVENAPGAVSYQWFVSDDSNGFTWLSTGVTSQNFTWTFFNDTNEIQSRGIRLVVSSGSETRESVSFITVGPGAEECQPGEIICS